MNRLLCHIGREVSESMDSKSRVVAGNQDLRGSGQGTLSNPKGKGRSTDARSQAQGQFGKDS